MPVEIKEVVIRAVLSQDNDWSDKEKQPDRRQADKESIVNACVSEVMRILKRSKQR